MIHPCTEQMSTSASVNILSLKHVLMSTPASKFLSLKHVLMSILASIIILNLNVLYPVPKWLLFLNFCGEWFFTACVVFLFLFYFLYVLMSTPGALVSSLCVSHFSLCVSHSETCGYAGAAIWRPAGGHVGWSARAILTTRRSMPRWDVGSLFWYWRHAENSVRGLC